VAIKLHGRQTKIYLNGQDISVGFNSIDGPNTADVADASTFGEVDKEFVVGLRSGNVRLQGIYDATEPGGIDTLLDSLAGVDQPAPIITYWPGNDILGYPGRAGRAMQTGKGVSSPVGGVVATNVDLQVSGGFDRVRDIFAKGTLSAPGGTITPDNGGTAVAAILTGYLQAFSVVSGTPVVVIEQSANGTSGWTTALTFTALQSGQTPQAQKATTTATIQPYKRVNISAGTAVVNVGYVQENT